MLGTNIDICVSDSVGKRQPSGNLHYKRLKNRATQAFAIKSISVIVR